MAERRLYRVLITLKGGNAIEADLVDPVIEVEDNKLNTFKWRDPKRGVLLQYVDMTEIAAITMRELSDTDSDIV